MTLVQVTRAKGISRERYETLREQATGGKLLEGELFFVDGYQGDEIWTVDGWETREACDRAMEKWGPALQAAGISMQDFALEEFEVDEIRLGSGLASAV